MFSVFEKQSYESLNNFKQALEKNIEQRESEAIEIANLLLKTNRSDTEQHRYNDFKNLVNEIAELNYISDLFTYLARDYAKTNEDKSVTYYKSSRWFKKSQEDALEDLISIFNKDNNLNFTQDRIKLFLDNEIQSLKDLHVYFDRKKYIAWAIKALGFALIISSVCLIFSGSLDASLTTLLIGAVLLYLTPLPSTYTRKSKDLNEKTDRKNINPNYGKYLKESQFYKDKRKAIEEEIFEITEALKKTTI